MTGFCISDSFYFTSFSQSPDIFFYLEGNTFGCVMNKLKLECLCKPFS